METKILKFTEMKVILKDTIRKETTENSINNRGVRK